MANLSVPRSPRSPATSNGSESSASAYIPSEQSEMSNKENAGPDHTPADNNFFMSFHQQLNHNHVSASQSIGDDTMNTNYASPAQGANLYDASGRLRVSQEVAAAVEQEARNQDYAPIDMDRAADLYLRNVQALQNGSALAEAEQEFRDSGRLNAAGSTTDDSNTRAAKDKKAVVENKHNSPSTDSAKSTPKPKSSRKSKNKPGNAVCDHGHHHGPDIPATPQAPPSRPQYAPHSHYPVANVPQINPQAGHRVLAVRNPNAPQIPPATHASASKPVTAYGSADATSLRGYPPAQLGYLAMPAASGNVQYYNQQGFSATTVYSPHTPQQQYSLTPMMSGGPAPYQQNVVAASAVPRPPPVQANHGNPYLNPDGSVNPYLLPGSSHNVRCCDSTCGSMFATKRAADGTPKPPRAHVGYNAHNGPAADCRKADAFGKNRFRCLWDGCNEFFGSGDDIKLHINNNHIPRHQYKTAPNPNVEPNGYACRWEGCPFVTKAARRYHLQSHILSHLGTAALRRLCVCGHMGKRMVDISKRHLPKCAFARDNGITVVGQLRRIYGSDWPGDDGDVDEEEETATLEGQTPDGSPAPSVGDDGPAVKRRKMSE